MLWKSRWKRRRPLRRNLNCWHKWSGYIYNTIVWLVSRCKYMIASLKCALMSVLILISLYSLFSFHDFICFHILFRLREIYRMTLVFNLFIYELSSYGCAVLDLAETENTWMFSLNHKLFFAHMAWRLSLRCDSQKRWRDSSNWPSCSLDMVNDLVFTWLKCHSCHQHYEHESISHPYEILHRLTIHLSQCLFIRVPKQMHERVMRRIDEEAKTIYAEICVLGAAVEVIAWHTATGKRISCLSPCKFMCCSRLAARCELCDWCVKC